MSTTPPPMPGGSDDPGLASPDTTGLGGKVFGLGLARTGTTSLHEAMGILGLRSAPDSIPLVDGIDLDFLAQHDCFFDNPIPFRYQALEAVCPHSRWIVTQRPVEDWLQSMRWLFGPGLDRLDPAMRRIGDRVHRRVYGTDRFDEDRLRRLYVDHYGALAEWTQTRDSLWLHVDHGLQWEPICELLALPVPPIAFPHTNRRRRGRSLRRGSA